MSTYSINDGTPYESTFLGDLSINTVLNEIPNNTSQLIVPENVRNALFTLWDNIAFKTVAATGSSVSYIGIGGTIHTEKYTNTADGLKVLMGKPQLNNSDILDNILIEYNDTLPYTNSDFYFYNFKPDDFSDGSANKQYTKVSFLAGDNSNDLFQTAPYILSQQTVGGTAIDLTIYNQGGKLIIDSAQELQIGSTSTKVTLLTGTGSTGVKTLPAGNPGDVQLNLDDCVFGFINGGSASVGDILLMGASNSPYWGDLNINSIFTLNQVLNSGNTTDGKDIIVTGTDSIYFGGTGSTYTSISNNGTFTLIDSPNGEFRIDTNLLRLDITGVGPNKVLYTDGTGYAFWATQSIVDPGSPLTSIQYNNNGDFGGSALLLWDNTSGTMTVNASEASAAISVAANNGGGVNIEGNNQDGLFHITNVAADLVKLTNKEGDLEDYSFILNGNVFTASEYMLSLKSNIQGGIFVNTDIEGSGAGQNAMVVKNANATFFDITVNDFETSTVTINDAASEHALNVKANNTGGLHVDSNNSSSVLLIENIVGADKYFEIDDSTKEMIFDDKNEYKFIFSGASTAIINKFTFRNGGAGDKDITLLANAANEEFNIAYNNASGASNSVISFSPDNNNGLFLGVSNSLESALFLGDFDGSNRGSVVVYPSTESTPPILQRATSKSVVIGNSSKTTQTLGTVVGTDADKRMLGINIVPQVDDHLNGVYAVNPSNYISTGFTLYSGMYYALNVFDTSYLMLDGGGYTGQTLHRLGALSEGGPVAPYGTTVRIWNRSGGNISVDTIYNTNEAARHNIFVPAISSPVQLTWATGTMLEFVYLAIGGDMSSTLAGLGVGGLLGEGGVWYNIN